MDQIISFLQNPTSHLITFCLGMAAVYRFMVLPERKKNDALQEHVDELFELQRDALRKIAEGAPPRR